MAFLTVSGISRTLEGKRVLDNITFTQHRHAKLAVAGQTGSGKSTLLKVIAGLVQPDEGQVIFENSRVRGPDEQLVPGHPEVAYLSQDFQLPKFLRVDQVLSYANSLPEPEALALYKLCSLEHLLGRKTDELSGGEKQRIALARLLLSWPDLLLLDEPFSNLDIMQKNILQEVIDNIGSRLKITCILVSHDPSDTLSWADKIIVLRDGKVVQKATPEKIYRYPASDYVAGLFGKFYRVAKGERIPGSRFNFVAEADVYLRPENFTISSKKRYTLSGKVVNVRFAGSHKEADVRAAGSVFTVYTSDMSLQPGKTIHLSNNWTPENP